MPVSSSALTRSTGPRKPAGVAHVAGPATARHARPPVHRLRRPRRRRRGRRRAAGARNASSRDWPWSRIATPSGRTAVKHHLRRDFLAAPRELRALAAQPEQRPAVAVGAGHHAQQARVAGEDSAGDDARRRRRDATGATLPRRRKDASLPARRPIGRRRRGRTGSGAGPNQRQPQCASTAAGSAIAASSASRRAIRHGHDAGGVGRRIIGRRPGCVAVAYNRVHRFTNLPSAVNPRLSRLQPYPFERLRSLFADVAPNPAFAPINLSIGEPRHPTPPLLLDALTRRPRQPRELSHDLGAVALREAIAGWLARRHGLPALDPATQVLPVLGSREALFAFAQTVVDGSRAGATVVMPNPFYQIYEGAALLAGAEPYCVNADPERGFAPDWDAVPEAVWARTQLVYVCSPDNPTGRVARPEEWRRLFALSDRHGFVIAADECYSEIYFDEANRRWARWRLRMRRGAMAFRASSSSAACRSARTRPACAPATSPATPLW